MDLLHRRPEGHPVENGQWQRKRKTRTRMTMMTRILMIRDFWDVIQETRRKRKTSTSLLSRAEKDHHPPNHPNLADPPNQHLADDHHPESTRMIMKTNPMITKNVDLLVPANEVVLLLLATVEGVPVAPLEEEGVATTE